MIDFKIDELTHQDLGQMQMYVDALTAEIRAQGKRYENREVVSVFFGGGTPTALEIPMLAQLMQAIRESFRVTADAELTTEANPGTLSYEMAAALKKMGFNRLSMGVQAWQNSILHRLGRIHTIEEFLENYHAVRQAGFENVNVDLMFALPGQSMAQWQETVRQIAALKPEHISAYSLIIEEGTPFYESYRAGKLELVSEEMDREMYHWTVDTLAEWGYGQYEISNFAKVGRQSRHNRIYWQAEEYLGMGLGAHSYMDGKRFHNSYDLQKYISAKGDTSLLREDTELITETDALAEFMFLGLRMNEGVTRAAFEQSFGVPIEAVYLETLRKLKDQGLLQMVAGRIALTDKGMDLANYVMAKFLL